MSKLRISIIILTRNNERLPRLLESIGKQKNAADFEVIVINSGKDNVKKIASQRSLSEMQKLGMFCGLDSGRAPLARMTVRVYNIKPSEFGHGRTRNWAIKKAKGEIIVFLSDDALPTNNMWLTKLAAPLENKDVAAVFGRQIPYKESSISERFSYLMAYPDFDRDITRGDVDKFSAGHLLFSNADSAIKKDLLIKYTFGEDVVMSEDHWWAREVLLKGFKIAYRKEGAVYHSHNYSLYNLFVRNFTSGYSLRGFGGTGILKSFFLGISYIGREIRFAAREAGYLSFLSYLRLFVYEFVRLAGFLAGKKGGWVPAEMRKRVMEPIAGKRANQF